MALGVKNGADSLVYWFAIFGIAMTRITHSRLRNKRKIDFQFFDAQEATFLVLCTFCMLIFPFAYLFSDCLDGFDYQSPPSVAVRSSVGCGLLVLSVLLFWKSHHDIGHNWSPTLEIHEGHKLVTSGIYGHIRHPMYASIFVFVVAQAILLPNLLGGLASLLVVPLVYSMRIYPEERMLKAQFGVEYIEYMSRTGRVLPRLWKSSQVAKVE